jgi:hypothetical protein
LKTSSQQTKSTDQKRPSINYPSCETFLWKGGYKKKKLSETFEGQREIENNMYGNVPYTVEEVGIK